MKKRILSIALVSALCTNLLPPTFAVAPPTSAPPIMTGILTADNGTQYTIEGVLVPAIQPLSTGSGTSVTYKYDIPTSVTAGGSTTAYDYDSGYVSTVYLTVDYNYKNTTPREYLLTGVSGHWEITDKKASVESATLTYGCTGLGPRPTTQYVHDAPVENYFSINAGFTQYIASDVLAAMGANLTVNYLMGTSRRWSFTLTNNPVDSLM